MRWPWGKRLPCRALPSSDDAEEAAAARRAAEEALQQTMDRTDEVKALAESLRRHRRVNHFAELFGRSLGGP